MSQDGSVRAHRESRQRPLVTGERRRRPVRVIRFAPFIIVRRAHSHQRVGGSPPTMILAARFAYLADPAFAEVKPTNNDTGRTSPGGKNARFHCASLAPVGRAWRTVRERCEQPPRSLLGRTEAEATQCLAQKPGRYSPQTPRRQLQIWPKVAPARSASFSTGNRFSVPRAARATVSSAASTLT